MMRVCEWSLALYLIVPCPASIVVASGAGSTPGTAQDLTAAYPDEIVGTLSGTDQNDVNMFQIFIRAPFNFSALTVLPGAFGIPDTVLSLFDSSGVGVYLNDDISGGNTLSCISSGGPSNPCPTSGAALSAGFYFLAISRSANYPVDGLSNEIFNPLSATDLAGPSSTDPVAGWDQGAFTSPDLDLVNYDIVLSGTVPEPSTGLLTICAGLALGLLRLRRRTAA